MKVGFVSLGCDKNRVDTEYIMAELEGDFELTRDKEQADIIVVNTCGFIESAKRESIDTILEMAELKKKNLKKLIATGCLAQRYGEELFDKIPELDVVLGARAYDKLKAAIESADRTLDLNAGEYRFNKRRLSTPGHYAYLKIAEGCDNRCAFCAIPAIKGRYTSRGLDDIDEELKLLCERQSVKELILVAQDVTRYGIDIYNEYALLKLLDTIQKYGFKWVRLLYCYPELVTDELIKAIRDRSYLCKYIDVPLQHIDNTVLRSMGRRNDGEYAVRLVERIREIDASIAIRSTFITGFPTETEAAYGKLCDFIETYKLENAGFFAFSKEEGTPAAGLKDLGRRLKDRRLNGLREIQSRVIEQRNARRIGELQDVVYEGIELETGAPYGRNQYNAPDIDCVVYFENAEGLSVGGFYEVKITDAVGVFDLKCDTISSDRSNDK